MLAMLFHAEVCADYYAGFPFARFSENSRSFRQFRPWLLFMAYIRMMTYSRRDFPRLPLLLDGHRFRRRRAQ